MRKFLLMVSFVWVALAGARAATYTWKGGASGAWSTSTNWNPERTTPATDDVLVFDLGNRDGANTAGDVNVSDVSNETIGQLQIVRATGSSTGFKILTMSGTITTLTITGDLVIGFYASGTNCRLNDGGNTIKVGGNFTTVNNQSASAVYHATGNGKIVFTNAAATLASGATSGNATFQNIEIGDGVNPANLTIGGPFLVKGNLHINSNTTITQNAKTLILESTSGVGGTISGSGNIIFTGSGGVLYIQGTAGAVEQNVGTMNLNTASEANSTINSIQFLRPNSVFTFGTAFNNNVVVNGSIRLNAGVFDDGGNVITVKGGTILDVTSTPGAGVHRGTGKIQAARTAASPLLVAAGKTLTVGNLEIGSTSGAVTYAVGSGTNLTINGTLTLSKAGSVINANGSTITFQNADIPIALTAGTITTDANTTLNFGSTSNTGGAAFSIPNGVFTLAPTVGTLNITRDNPLTLNNQAVTATTINVNPGSKLSLGAAVSATNLNLKSNASKGTATLLDNGNTVTATTPNVEQTLSSGRQWWYLSSPLSAASSSVFSGDQIGKHVEDYVNDGNPSTTAPYYTSPFSTPETMTPGRGYVVKRASTAEQTYTFTGGSLNTGDKPATVTRTGTTAAKRGFNLVGNPYPSFIDWDLVYANATGMRNAIWMRTFNGSAMTFYTYGDGDGVPVDLASDRIAPMQAFWVKVDADNTTPSLTFKNTHRDHFTTGANPLRVKANDLRPRLRLVVSNGQEKDETLIVGKSYASNLLDSYDIEKMSADNTSIPELFSLVQNQEMVINSMQELNDGKLVQLGFRPGLAGNYTLEVTQLENIDVKAVLVDHLTSSQTELQAGTTYSFSSDATATNSRFSVEFRAPGTTTSLKDVNASNTFVYVTDANQIAVQSMAITKADVIRVYNMAGQQLAMQNANGQSTLLKQSFSAGVYLVKVNNHLQKVIVK